jgi:hypothetical protein
MVDNTSGYRLRTLLLEIGRETLGTSLDLIKIMVPAVLITKILEELGLIEILSRLLEPIMGLMGLPGSLGLVWATAILTTPYSAIAVFSALAPSMELSTAQITVLCSIMLIAHSLPVEMSITRRAGAGLWPIGAIRLFGALAYGVILHYFCLWTGIWQGPARILFQPGPAEQTLVQWSISQVLNLGLIIFIIFCILVAMRLLRAVGFMTLLERMLSPVLPLFGMSHRAAPVTVVGMIMGIAIGGGLIIRETTTGTMDRREIFNSLALMSLSHGLIEDTLVMMAMGGALGGILWGRLLFSLVVLYLLVKAVDYCRARQNSRARKLE